MSDSTPSYFKSVPDELPVRRVKTAIVTGASSGIGLELAKKLSLNGYRVVGNSRRITSARTLTETEHIKRVDGDISLPETAERVVASAIQHFGTIDLLVNNAGVFLPKPFTEYTTEDLRVAVATNLFGFFFVSQLAVARMRLQKFGQMWWMQYKSLLWRPGGIADGRGLKAALALGAEGVQIGTAFLACAGSGANTTYREALLSKDTPRTELTDKFTGRLARGIKNHLMDELSDIDSTVMPFPLQHALVQTVAQPASMRGRADLMTLWAGQSVGLCQHADAAELMTELIAALEDIRKSEFEELGRQAETASR